LLLSSCSSNLYVACEGHFGRSRQPDVLSRTVPVYSQLAAAHADVHLPVELAPAPPHRDGSAGTRAAGQRLADAALVHPQTDVRAVDDLHESRIHAPGEAGMPLDCRPEPLHRGGIDRLHSEDGMRVADRYGADFDAGAGDLERIALRLSLALERQRARIEAHRPHVHGYEAVFQHARPNQSGGTVHRNASRARESARRQECGDAADAVTAL